VINIFYKKQEVNIESLAMILYTGIVVYINLMKHFSSFRNNRSNKKKGHDSVLTLVELQNKLVVGDELGMIGIWRHQ
jgi:predicted Ser/Thr protein kinase